MKLISSKNIISILILSLLWSCSYSFTGSSVPPHLKTISIPTVKDRSGSGEAYLSNDFTENLVQQFVDDNSLQVTNSTNSDAILLVTVVSLGDRAEVISGVGEKATERKVTITVKAVYKDLIMKKTIFDKRLSNYATYDASQGAAENRQAAILEAIENVNLDLLLAVVSDW